MPTIRDVARLSGVSVGTVSAVINNSARVSERTKQRVLACMDEQSYRPNNIARNLKRHRVSTVGLIVPDLQNPFFSSIAEGVHRAVEECDVLLILCVTWARSDREQYFAQTLQTRRMDGIIYLSGSGIPSPHLLALARHRQIVFVDEILPGIDIPFISARNRSGAREIASEVLAKGHRRIAIIAGPRRLWTNEQRLAGYREAFAAAGFDPDVMPVLVGDYGEASGYQLACELLSRPGRRITGILCANDLMAIGAMQFCQKAGLRVPTDVSITGFDDIPAASLLEPPLTTVSQPGQDMGYAAAQLLLHQIGNASRPIITEFPTTLRMRSSIASPPADQAGLADRAALDGTVAVRGRRTAPPTILTASLVDRPIATEGKT